MPDAPPNARRAADALRRAAWVLLAGGLAALLLLGVARPPGSQPPPTVPAAERDTPWPKPYAQVSPASVAWLKARGWWPLSIGYFADLPGYAAHDAVVRALGLLEARGIEVRWQSFLSGPPILEAFVSGQTQVTGYGDFPFWSTVDKGVPAVAFALTGVNNHAALLVPPGSPVRSPADWDVPGEPLVVGTTLGSYAEFYVTAMAQGTGLAERRGVELAGMSMREAQLLPAGVDAVAAWDPHVAFAVERGLGRAVDTVHPWYLATGYEFVRAEIEADAPDVVQALSDATLEAVLWIREHPERAADVVRADPRLRAYDAALVRAQVERYYLLYKPSVRYVHADVWAAEGARVVATMAAKGRMKRARTAEELKVHFVPDHMARSLATMGWAVPPRPVFLPEGWAGTPGRPPYPAYDTPVSLTAPQPWPEPSDLLVATPAAPEGGP